VISLHNDVGLEVGGGTAVSRSVISTPRSTSTIGLDYGECCQFARFEGAHEGCQDGSNSVQDHVSDPALNILVGQCIDDPDNGFTSPVVTDGWTNCGGDRVPVTPATHTIGKSC
jgi:hypothetical protein